MLSRSTARVAVSIVPPWSLFMLSRLECATPSRNGVSTPSVREAPKWDCVLCSDGLLVIEHLDVGEARGVVDGDSGRTGSPARLSPAEVRGSQISILNDGSGFS